MPKKRRKVNTFKPIFLAIIIIIFVLILDFITVNNTKKIVDFMNNSLNDIDEKLAQDEYPDMEAKNLLTEWEKNEKILSYYLEHDEVEKIGNSINLIKKQIEIRDYDDARQSITETKFLFDHIEEKQILNVENFF